MVLVRIKIKIEIIYRFYSVNIISNFFVSIEKRRDDLH